MNGRMPIRFSVTRRGRAPEWMYIARCYVRAYGSARRRCLAVLAAIVVTVVALAIAGAI